VSVQPDLQAVLDAVRILSPSSRSPVHGEVHWRRVATNGLDLAAEVGADPLLVVLFGIFHDSMRFSEHRTTATAGEAGSWRAASMPI
jgi:HD superfamily phosphodiesterase